MSDKERPAPRGVKPAKPPARSSLTWLRVLFAVSLVCLVSLVMFSNRGGFGLLSLWLSSALTATTGPSRADTSPHDSDNNSPGLPFVINTWSGPFEAATDAAYSALAGSKPDDTSPSALDAVELGCATCEANQCDGTVGYGGSPDEQCETTLDAMIMDGVTMKSGAVAAVRRIKNVIGVARHVLEHTTHTMLAGDLATQFAVANGFVEEDLTTQESRDKCEAWREARCQPNYRLSVSPDPEGSCGPYTPLDLGDLAAAESGVNYHDLLEPRSKPVGHDTISMIAIGAKGTMAAGTSTNGASHKIPGRVGDGPITGSGSYVDGEVGGCGATGDGDIMMRFLPCYQAVENLRRGMTPRQAAEDAVRRMLRKYPQVSSGVVVVNTRGEHGGAGSGWTFSYSYRGGGMNETAVVSVPPLVAEGSGADL